MDNQNSVFNNQTKAICTYKRINGIEEIVFVKNGNIYGITKVKLCATKLKVCAAKSENKAGTS